MKKVLKKEVIIAFIVGIILASSIAVYAYSYAAKDISYTKPGTDTAISVETALNDLYSKSNKTPQQVATLTTQGASYTFQNDGYITGTAAGEGDSNSLPWYAATLSLNDETIIIANEGTIRPVSVYVSSGTAVVTRQNRGTYNLTCYEFK